MPLTDFFKFQTPVESSRVLFVDWHNLAHRNLFVANYSNPTDTKFIYWKFLMMQSILCILKKFAPRKLIIASEAKNSWRKGIYPEYKAHRKVARDKSTIDFDEFYKTLEVFNKEVSEIFCNAYFLEVERAEADDIIATLCKKQFLSEEVVISSMDTDFVQLLVNKNIKLWSPVKKEFTESINPSADLEVKIIMGDKSDNIPAIRKKVGPATANKLIKEGKIYADDCDVDTKNNMQRNRTLIDLNNTPTEIQEAILTKYNQTTLQPINAMNLMTFMTNHRIVQLVQDLPIYQPYFNKLNP